MQAERTPTISELESNMKDHFDPPEPFNEEKLLKILSEDNVKQVSVFKASPEEIEKRINLCSKGQRRKFQKKWDHYRKTGEWE